MEILLYSREAAKMLGIDPQTLEIWARRGKIPAAKIGRHWCFLESRLDEWLRGQIKLPKPTVPEGKEPNAGTIPTR